MEFEEKTIKTLFVIVSGLVGLIILVIAGAAIYLHFSPPPRQIQIGMSFQDFYTFCALDAEDWVYVRTSTTETASGSTLTLDLPSAEKNYENGCYGTFIFVNNKLTSITR